MDYVCYNEREVEVRLFSVAHGRNHYLGEFSAGDVRYDRLENRTFVKLHRYNAQSDALKCAYQSRKRPRSKREAMHLSSIQTLLGPEWTIFHEPEAAVNFDTPLVEDGEMVSWCSASYTVDYVAASRKGCGRLCFESKYDLAGVTDSALLKCRVLRDQSLCRTIIVAGHGQDLRWLDFGTTDEPNEVWCETSDELRARLMLRDAAA